MTPQNTMIFLLSLAILLGVARALGELAQRFNQPAVLGELIAGVLLGPTILGRAAPEIFAFLFPLEGPNATALGALSDLAIVLFLLVAGIEVDLSAIWRQGKVGLKVGLASIGFPFLLGFCAAWLAPGALGRSAGADALIFSLFVAIGISISALPIIAKTLMDIDLYRSDLGMVIISAAILNDLIGWMVFALILGLIGDASAAGHSIARTVALTLVFSLTMLTLARWAIHKLLPYIQAYTRWPGGELSFALILALLGAACSQWIGIHAIFGSFLVGAAIGDSAHLRERTRVTITQFVSFFFAPLFFATIGLKVDFVAHFDGLLVVTVVGLAGVLKLAGGVLGAAWGGLPPRESAAVGFGMVSVGAMGIIVGLLALQSGIIAPRLFVALVLMAMGTSMVSGPAIQSVLRLGKKQRLADLLSARLFIADLHADSRRSAIGELAQALSDPADMSVDAVETAVWKREEIMSTGIGNGVAIPHARLADLRAPLVAVGISQAGIDFDAPDAIPAHVIFLILTPAGDPDTQLGIAAELARLFRNPQLLDRVRRTRSFTDFLALIRSGAPASSH